MTPREALRYHVTGAVERGEATAIGADEACQCGTLVIRNGIPVRGFVTYADGARVCLAAGTPCHDARIERDHA